MAQQGLAARFLTEGKGSGLVHCHVIFRSIWHFLSLISRLTADTLDGEADENKNDEEPFCFTPRGFFSKSVDFMFLPQGKSNWAFLNRTVCCGGTEFLYNRSNLLLNTSNKIITFMSCVYPSHLFANRHLFSPRPESLCFQQTAHNSQVFIQECLWLYDQLAGQLLLLIGNMYL